MFLLPVLQSGVTLPETPAFGPTLRLNSAFKSLLSCFALLIVLCFGALSANAQTSSTIYGTDGSRFQNGWQNWSWATVNPDDGARFHTGPQSISVSAGPYQALFLHHDAFDSTPYESLSFWINGGASTTPGGAPGGGQILNVQGLINGQAQTAYSLPPLQAETWQLITIPLSALGVANNTGFDGFWIQSNSNATLPIFYVDDITLIASPPPSSIAVNINAQTVIRTVSGPAGGRSFGVNTAIWDSNLGSQATRDLLGAMGSPTLRFPGGSASDDYDWSTNRSVTNGGPFQWASSAATFAALCQATNTQAYITVNYGSGTPEQAAAWVAYYNGSPSNSSVLGVDAKGRDWKTAGYWAAIRAATPLATDDGYNFLRVGRAIPYNFRYWEVGNENYGSWETDQHGGVLSGSPHDGATYATWFKLFYAKMLAVDPSIRVGAVYDAAFITPLAAQGATPHFVIYHRYPQGGGGENDSFLLQGSSAIVSDISGIRSSINSAYGAAGAGIGIALTELNSVSFNPGKQSTSLVNGLFLADSMGYFMRTEADSCVWWDLRNGADATQNNSNALYGWRLFGDYGMVAAGDRADTPVNTPYPQFYGAKLLTHWARSGDQILAASSPYSLLSIHAAKLASGQLAFLVVNKHPSANLTAQIALSNFVPGSSTATVFQYGKANDLSNGDLTSTTLSGVGSNFSATFPAYSMSVVLVAAPVTTPTSPAAPSNLTATTASSSQINLAWVDKSSNESGFKIERSLDGITWNLLKTVGANVSTFSNTGLAVGTRYFYRIYAYAAGLPNSAFSNTANATTLSPPVAPSNLTATAVSFKQINLAWTDNSSNESGFRIERSLDGTIWGGLTTVGANVSTYSNTGLKPSTRYVYRVQASLGGAPNSAFSNIADVTTLAPPAAPSNLTATAVSTSQINLAWTDNSNNEENFRIERSVNGTTWNLLKTVGANISTFANTGLSTNTRYFYRVSAYAAGAPVSPYSNSADATTLAPPVTAPTRLRATAVSPSQINLVWTDQSSNEAGFKIECSRNGTNWSQIGAVRANGWLYPNMGLTPNTHYLYRVRSYITGCNSTYSNISDATTPRSKWKKRKNMTPKTPRKIRGRLW